MEKTVTVMRSGNSAVVALPAGWRRSLGIEVGDKLNASWSSNGALSLAREGGSGDARLAAFEDLMDEVEAAPRVPWPDDSRQADREAALRRG